MGLASILNAAATSAQTTIAQMQGMVAGAGNTLFEGRTTPVTGAYGTPRVIFIGVPGGGYRKRTETELSVTRAQLASLPAFQTKVVRTDQTPNVTYVIDRINSQSPLSYVFTLVSFAG